MPDPIYPRVATVIKATGEVAVISARSGPPDARDKKEIAADVYEWVAVVETVRAGMVRQKDGSFDWPEGHPNEIVAKRRARGAKAAEAA